MFKDVIVIYSINETILIFKLEPLFFVSSKINT